ncbi:ribosome silencing factor [Actinomyces lilanjuaniae]|uniref:Ribosomal silencing factor RsfS n=1 Tax=Actinomyces lilanjuaniae TaxID=2321394 RepID=A0ABN5PNP0_9ACTO|nr:ribosome silencing factor [Actinomyces lilanjuaniae]AYD89998.1 ribosome silencing factor [Actinomyces lilanjuaniae]
MPASASDYAVGLTRTAVRAATDRKGYGAVAIDVSQRLGLTDVFLVLTASNDRQVRAVVDAVEEAMHGAGAVRRAREGLSEARWVLLDYGDLVVHVLQEQDREFYGLERLWKDCPLIALPDDAGPGLDAVPGSEEQG